VTEEYNDSDLEKILKEIYPPETASPQFKEKLRRQLIEAAGRPAPRPFWHRPLVWAPVIAAIVLGLIAYFVATAVISPRTVRSGSLEVWVTDDRPTEISSVEVTITEVQVHRAGDDSADDDGWMTVISDYRTFDLIALRDSDMPGLLGDGQLEAGHYTQIRLSVDNVTVDDMAAEVPGDNIRVVGQFDIEIKADCTTQVTLDFDLDDPNSLVFTGEGKILFQPVIKPIIGEPCQEEPAPQ
jgi:hypothetical protein